MTTLIPINIPIFRRTNPHKLLKHGRKIRSIMIPHHFRNGIDIDIRTAQQFLCLVNAKLVDIVGQGDAGGFFEGPA